MVRGIDGTAYVIVVTVDEGCRAANRSRFQEFQDAVDE
jgi:hypothetical protein